MEKEKEEWGKKGREREESGVVRTQHGVADSDAVIKYPTNQASASHDFKVRISKGNSNKSQSLHIIVFLNICVLTYDYFVQRCHVDNSASIIHHTYIHLFNLLSPLSNSHSF